MLHLRLMEHLCLLMMVLLIIKLQQPSAWREPLSSCPLQLSATLAYSGGPMIGTGMCFFWVDFGLFIVYRVLFRSYGILILILFNNLIRVVWVNPDAK